MAGPRTLNSTPVRASKPDTPIKMAVPGQRIERKQKLSRNATRNATGPAQASCARTNVTITSTKSCTLMKDFRVGRDVRSRVEVLYGYRAPPSAGREHLIVLQHLPP